MQENQIIQIVQQGAVASVAQLKMIWEVISITI